MNNSIIKDIIEWDVENWSKSLKYWEKNIDIDFKDLRCLELGGRNGGLSLWLAKKGANVICSDIVETGKTAKPMHEKYYFSGQISYEVIDATNIPYDNEFDIIVFKSMLGGIARNAKDSLKKSTIYEIYKSLKPNGILLFAENLEASGIHVFFRRNFTKWGLYWNYLKYSEIKEVFNIFDEINFHTCGFWGTFGRTENKKFFLGKLDTFFFNRVVPPKYRYIVFGMAYKHCT